MAERMTQDHQGQLFAMRHRRDGKKVAPAGEEVELLQIAVDYRMDHTLSGHDGAVGIERVGREWDGPANGRLAVRGHVGSWLIRAGTRLGGASMQTS
jgi:hypothetical protein